MVSGTHMTDRTHADIAWGIPFERPNELPVMRYRALVIGGCDEDFSRFEGGAPRSQKPLQPVQRREQGGRRRGTMWASQSRPHTRRSNLEFGNVVTCGCANVRVRVWNRPSSATTIYSALIFVVSTLRPIRALEIAGRSPRNGRTIRETSRHG